MPLLLIMQKKLQNIWKIKNKKRESIEYENSYSGSWCRWGITLQRII